MMTNEDDEEPSKDDKEICNMFHQQNVLILVWPGHLSQTLLA